jgi:hypothetical protein
MAREVPGTTLHSKADAGVRGRGYEAELGPRNGGEARLRRQKWMTPIQPGLRPVRA